MKNVLIIFLSLTLYLTASSQNQYKGIIKDVSTDMPLIGANVTIDGTFRGVSTDENGAFEITINQFPTILTVSYIGYSTRQITILNLSKNGEIIFLTPTEDILPEIVVSDKPIIEKVYKQPYSVKDYVFFDNYIILLVYRNVFKKHSLILLDKNGEIVHEKNIKDWKAQRLYKGCLGGIHLVTQSHAHQIYLKGRQIEFFPKGISITKFESQMTPCVTSNLEYVFMERRFWRGLEVQFETIPKNRPNDRAPLANVRDDYNIRLLEDEASFQQLRAFAAESGAHSSSSTELGETVFASILYKPVYAPLFEYSDTIFLFNHIDNVIQKMNTSGTVISKIPIEYHKEKENDWRKVVLFDHERRKAYTLFDTRWAIELQEINLETGELGHFVTLDRPHIKNIKIKDGYVYFLYHAPQNGVTAQRLEKMILF